MAHSPHVTETTAERFEADVVERSQLVPVVLDFWAAWCQPCRLLAPLLEKMADEYEGKFVVVKADTDQLPEQAQAFGVQGIPAVFAVKDGQVVDSFTGLLTEPQLRQWLGTIVPTAAETLVKEAAALEAADRATAQAKYRRAMELDSNLPVAKIGLARALLADGQTAEAGQLLEQLADRGFLEPEAQRLKAEAQLRGGSVSGDELSRLQQAAEQSPQDALARLRLAEALLAAGQYREGLTLALEVVASQQGPPREEARQRMLDAFRVLGDDSEITRDFRRQLAMALY